MIHLCGGDNPLLGCYAFARITAIDGNTITFDRDITTENGDDFTLSEELRTSYTIQVITVLNFMSLTINAGVTVNSCSGGVVAFRCTGNCTVNVSIITHGNGITRTFTAPSTARLGASWSGLGDGSNGSAGYGDNGYVGGGGGGCGGNGGEGTNSNYGTCGSGGGGQGGSGGSGGAGKKVTGNAGTINGGDFSVTSNNPSGAGGGGPGGNGGNGYRNKSSSAASNFPGGVAGASIILISNRLAVDEAALSTGGGGTGFCYIACNERVSA